MDKDDTATLGRAAQAAGETMTGAQMVIRALKDQGVTHIFGYPGGAVLPIYDAIFHDSRIRHILVRQEAGAAHAAQKIGAVAQRFHHVGLQGDGLAVTGQGVAVAVQGFQAQPAIQQRRRHARIGGQRRIQ